MNPEQQRERFTAVSRVERRMDDVEEVVGGLAAEIVAHRSGITDDLAAFNERLRKYADAEAKRLDRVDAHALQRHIGLAEAFLAFEHQTVWQRLRWLVRGA